MDFRKFLQHLRNYKNNFYVDQYNKIRHLEYKEKGGKKKCCPLNVLCQRIYKNTDIDDFAIRLNMEPELANRIANACDFSVKELQKNDCEDAREEKLMREAILVVLELDFDE